MIDPVPMPDVGAVRLPSNDIPIPASRLQDDVPELPGGGSDLLLVDGTAIRVVGGPSEIAEAFAKTLNFGFGEFSLVSVFHKRQDGGVQTVPMFINPGRVVLISPVPDEDNTALPEPKPEPTWADL